MKKYLYLFFFILIISVAETDVAISQPVNDSPCSATYLTFGVYIPGYTNGSTYTSEPPVTSCFDAGPYNTVWYYFTAPASGCATIKTTCGTIADTQIGVYQGACSTLVALPPPNCNDNVSGCSGYNYRFSLLQLSGLTPGNSYYIMVDGWNVITGNFTITVEDVCSGVNLPPVPGRDCLDPFPVCSYTIDVGNPGYSEYGNICDFNSTVSCLLQGEKESVWYAISINGNGNLEFNIVPNDWTSGCTNLAETDYDFAIWKIGGSGTLSTCGSLGTPVRCNYDNLGLTGCYQTGVASPAAYGGACWDDAYEPAIPVLFGEKYLLVISNWDNTNYGFKLSIQPTSPIVASVPPGGSVVWTGTTNTSWFTISNWGGCQIPDCSHGAVIPSFPVNQPVISVSGASVRDLLINTGASLTLNSGMQMMICGDFNNYGTFNALSNSTVLLEDTAVTPPLTKFHNQTLAVNLKTPSDFWHVTVKKPPGYKVMAAADIDMTGNFLVTGGTYGGAFEATNMDHRVGGNFTVDVTAPNIASYLEGTSLHFIGTVQTYLNRGVLDSVFMEQTGAGTLTLQNHGGASAWMTVSDSGALILNYGKIITGTNRVEVQNRAIDAVTPGNLNSYIQGTSGLLSSCLQRYLNQSGTATGIYEFPVGTSARGYQRLSLEFTSPLPSGVNYFYASFNDNTPANNTAIGTECTVNYHAAPASPLNNGFWQLQPVPASQFSSGIYTPYLYNRSYTNAMAGYTVMVNKINPTVAANWFLEPAAGTVGCAFINALPITDLFRPNASVALTMQNTPTLYLGTAQSVDPLPVELLYFGADSKEKNITLKWITASEINNAGFELERSLPSSHRFEKIAFISGNGTTTEQHSYSFDDYNISFNTDYFYRLRQIDFDGNYDYSNIISAKITEGDFDFSLFSDPFSGNTFISYNLKANSTVSFQILNTLGQKIELIKKGVQEKGYHTDDISTVMSKYANGIYLVRMIIDDTVYTKRILLATK